MSPCPIRPQWRSDCAGFRALWLESAEKDSLAAERAAAALQVRLSQTLGPAQPGELAGFGTHKRAAARRGSEVPEWWSWEPIQAVRIQSTRHASRHTPPMVMALRM